MKFITKEVVKELDKEKVNIALYHGFVVGSGEDANNIEKEESVKMLSVGGKEAVLERYFLDFDYVALGHLHGNRKVKSEKVRYCGSPIKYSFSEKNQEKKFTIIDIDKDNFNLEFVEIKEKYPMIEISGTLEEVMNANINKDAYLKIILTEKVLNAMSHLRTKYSQIMELRIEEKTGEIKKSEYSLKDVGELSTNQLFINLANSVGVELEKSEIEYLEKVIQEINEGAN
jgi:exonuclease SbcD